MEQTILLFEDEGYRSLLPLTYTRTAADIRCGMYTLRERLRRLYGQEPQALTRSYLADVYGSGRWPLQVLASNRPVLLINSRLIDCGCLAQMVDAPIGTILLSDDNNTARSGGTLVAARLSPSLAKRPIRYRRTHPVWDSDPPATTHAQLPLGHHRRQRRDDWQRCDVARARRLLAGAPTPRCGTVADVCA